MAHEGERITAVRDLTEDEVSILGYLPRGRDTIPGLELESGAVIFPSGDEEGNMAGEWPVQRDGLEEYVGMYVTGWMKKNEPDVVHGNRSPVELELADEPPEIDDDGNVTTRPTDNYRIVPYGSGVGPAAWFIRAPVDEDTRPDPEETPTPSEVLEMQLSGEIEDIDEYNELLTKAETAHNDAVFHTIC